MFIKNTYLLGIMFLTTLPLAAATEESPFKVTDGKVCLSGICGRRLSLGFRNFKSAHLSIKSETTFNIDASVENEQLIILLNGKQYNEKDLRGELIFVNKQLYNEQTGDLINPVEEESVN